MKNTLYRLSLVAGLVAASSLSAYAEPADGEKKERRGPSREEILEKFDENGDGELDEAERAKAAEARKAAMKKRILERFDEDGDGELNDEERAKAKEAMKRFHNRRGKGDGKGRRGPGGKGRGEGGGGGEGGE